MEKNVRVRLSDGSFIEGRLLEPTDDETATYYKHPYYGVELESGNVICAKADELTFLEEVK